MSMSDLYIPKNGPHIWLQQFILNSHRGPAFAVWEPNSLCKRVYAAFGWKWISSGHRFSPKFSRSAHPIFFIIPYGITCELSRLLFPLEPSKANQTLGRLNFSWLSRLGPNCLKRRTQEAAIPFHGKSEDDMSLYFSSIIFGVHQQRARFPLNWR